MSNASVAPLIDTNRPRIFKLLLVTKRPQETLYIYIFSFKGHRGILVQIKIYDYSHEVQTRKPLRCDPPPP